MFLQEVDGGLDEGLLEGKGKGGPAHYVHTRESIQSAGYLLDT